MKRSRFAGALFGLGAAATLACGSATEPEAPAATSEPATSEPRTPPTAPAASVAYAREQAQEIFDMRCVTCHGAGGAGDGPGSASLTPAPRNFQDPEWQASVSDDHLEKIIQYGGAAVGRSAAMPGNPDLTAQPEVLAALVALIRGLNAE